MEQHFNASILTFSNNVVDTKEFQRLYVEVIYTLQALNALFSGLPIPKNMLCCELLYFII